MMNTLPVRDGRSLSVKDGAGGKKAENKEGMIGSNRVRLRFDVNLMNYVNLQERIEVKFGR